jgi:hypothetical protein
MATDTKDAALADAHAAILQAISDLRAMGVTPPISLHRAAHALSYTTASRPESARAGQ